VIHGFVMVCCFCSCGWVLLGLGLRVWDEIMEKSQADHIQALNEFDDSIVVTNKVKDPPTTKTE